MSKFHSSTNNWHHGKQTWRREVSKTIDDDNRSSNQGCIAVEPQRKGRCQQDSIHAYTSQPVSPALKIYIWNLPSSSLSINPTLRFSSSEIIPLYASETASQHLANSIGADIYNYDMIWHDTKSLHQIPPTEHAASLCGFNTEPYIHKLVLMRV